MNGSECAEGEDALERLTHPHTTNQHQIFQEQSSVSHHFAVVETKGQPMRLSIVAMVLTIGSSTQVFAQTESLSTADKAFLTKDRRGATYELEAAKLAVTKATRADVKSYAEKITRDHQTYNAALEQLGKQEGLTLPTEPDAEDQSRLTELEGAKGSAFDDLFVKEAIRINAEDKTEADKEKADTKIPAIREFLGKFASMDAEHEALAKQLDSAKN